MVEARQLRNDNSPLDGTQPNQPLSVTKTPHDNYLLNKILMAIDNDQLISRKSKLINISLLGKSIVLKGFVENQSDYYLIIDYARSIAPHLNIIDEMSVRQ